jgi:hypothetical protein
MFPRMHQYTFITTKQSRRTMKRWCSHQFSVRPLVQGEFLRVQMDLHKRMIIAMKTSSLQFADVFLGPPLGMSL